MIYQLAASRFRSTQLTCRKGRSSCGDWALTWNNKALLRFPDLLTFRTNKSSWLLSFSTLRSVAQVSQLASRGLQGLHYRRNDRVHQVSYRQSRADAATTDDPDRRFSGDCGAFEVPNRWCPILSL